MPIWNIYVVSHNNHDSFKRSMQHTFRMRINSIRRTRSFGVPTKHMLIFNILCTTSTNA